MIIAIIRHSITEGNLRGEYSGAVDHPLCPQGIALAKLRAPTMPKVQAVLSSPMKRARETAALLFPKESQSLEICPSLYEYRFGDYDGKTHEELCHDPQYTQWITAKGSLPPPNGEDIGRFQRRCVKGFLGCANGLSEKGIDSAALILHGGVIMSIMSTLALRKDEFYAFQLKNCEGYLTEFAGERLSILSHIGESLQ